MNCKIYTMQEGFERFWMRVNRNGPTPSHRPELGPCWEFKALRSGEVLVGKYGYFELNGERFRAHRFSWFVKTGERAPNALHVCHHCDNPACVNPDRLFLGDDKANMIDARNKGRFTYVCERNYIPHNRIKTHCKRGHPFDEANTFVNGGKYRGCRTCKRLMNGVGQIKRRAQLKARRDAFQKGGAK